MALARALVPKSEIERRTGEARAPLAGLLFTGVWSVNNLLTLWGNREVLNAPDSPDRTAYLRLEAATWLLYVAYGPLFFRLKSPVLGQLNAVSYLALTLAAAKRAANIDRKLLGSFATLVPWLFLAATGATWVAATEPDPLFGG